jgi:hypothetical protein
VLFSLEKAVNEQTTSEKLFSMLQRCFKSVDKEECGYIPSDKLQEVMEMIGTHREYDAHPIFEIVYDVVELARLRGHLQIDGEIILWTAFWVNVSKLMMGESLDNLIQCAVPSEGISGKADNSGGGGSGGRKRSDSEIARQLQAELDANPNLDIDEFYRRQQEEEFAAAADRVGGGGRPRSDSEIARELQEQWNAGGSGDVSFSIDLTSPVGNPNRPRQDQDQTTFSSHDAK